MILRQQQIGNIRIVLEIKPFLKGLRPLFTTADAMAAPRYRVTVLTPAGPVPVPAFDQGFHDFENADNAYRSQALGRLGRDLPPRFQSWLDGERRLTL